MTVRTAVRSCSTDVVSAAEILHLLIERTQAHLLLEESERDDDGTVPTHEDVAQWSAWAGLDHDALLDEVALALAREYDGGSVSFEVGDWIANDLYSYCLFYDLPWPDVFFEVYLAFDEGEYSHHGASDNPESDYTRPMIKELLGRASQA